MSIIKNNSYRIGFSNKEEEIYYLLLMEITFLDYCLSRAKDETEKELIRFGLKKLENLHKIFLKTSTPWTHDDYDNSIRFIYETLKLITSEVSNI
ncbi:MAG: hypothetical protein ACOC1X_02595 [Promethearchaeota archaeon]